MDAFSVRTKIMIGGGMDALAQRLHRVFLVTDKFMAESGKTNYVTDRLLRSGGEFKIFSDVQADPDIATVTRGVEQILEFQPDAVVAFGGGSAIDAAKAIVFFAARERDMRDCKFIAIPTTCGTGSECTNISVAIVKDEKDGVLTGGETKLGLVSDDIIPNKVCLIPELLKTLPYKPFACSAIDALVHATESFLSPHRKTMTSELFSEKAMDVILKGFKLIDEKGQDARFEYMDQFVTASFYAGIAFLKAGCGPVHGMSFPLGGTYHVPHGESNYMLFGAIMDYYDEHKPDGEIMKFKELVSSILGCEVKDAIPEMNALLQRILPLRPLRDCGFTEADFKAFPLSVEANQQRLMTNAYYPFDLESEEAIYRKCY